MPSLLSEAAEVLGLELPDGKPPSEDEITAAFKKLAIRWHPDRNPDNVEEATLRFAEVSAARDLLLDPQAARENTGPHPKSQHSTSLRTFEGDVSDLVRRAELEGADSLFEGFELWAVWLCNTCGAICCRLRKNKYLCLCGHKLAHHRPSRGMRCEAGPGGASGCGCDGYEFLVQFDAQPVKCRCKHAAGLHTNSPPFECRSHECECPSFDPTWICHCGHPCREHRTAYVRKKLPERAREWVAGGLRGECVALAKRFRTRSPRTRAAFIQRANAAHAARQPSFKAMQRDARSQRTSDPSASRRPSVTGSAARMASGSAAAPPAAVSPVDIGCEDVGGSSGPCEDVLLLAKCLECSDLDT